MKAIVQLHAGQPETTMELRTVPSLAAPHSGNVVVGIDLASVHHGDLFLARRAKQLPSGQESFATGTEAVGRLISIADDVAADGTFRVGDRVAVFMASGTWSEQIELPVINICKVPDDIPDTIAAQLFVNTITALMVLRTLKGSVSTERLAGATVLLTGASTAVARILARLMLAEALHVVALTRSPGAAERMRRLIPDIPYFATADDNWTEAVSASIGDKPIVAVADCVSGTFLSQIGSLIDDDASIITYGGLDDGPIGLTGLEITSRQLEIRGVTVGRWLTHANEDVRAQDLATVIALARSHPEIFTVNQTFDIANWRDAISAVEQPGRDGFVFLRP